jgi:hypothetical protein
VTTAFDRSAFLADNQLCMALGHAPQPDAELADNFQAAFGVDIDGRCLVAECRCPCHRENGWDEMTHEESEALCSRAADAVSASLDRCEAAHPELRDEALLDHWYDGGCPRCGGAA